MNISFEIDNESYKNVENILSEIGLDCITAVKMFFKKVLKENTIAFLFNGENNKSVLKQNNDINVKEHVTESNSISINKNVSTEMCKSIAKRMLLSKSIPVYSNITFASKNKSANNYWANPSFEMLEYDWTLLLNDKKNKVLYVFNIPAKSIDSTELVCRSDKNELIDLQIMYEDPTFTDNRSGYSFYKYLTNRLNY